MCETFIKSKTNDAPYPKLVKNRANEILDLINSDVCGPINIPTIWGKKYFLTFNGDYSRFTIIYSLLRKSEVFDQLKEYVAMVHNNFSKKPKVIRSDNGVEYINK